MEKTDILQLKKYFPTISDKQIHLFKEISELYIFWNKQINVISQKDIDNLFVRHILHSLSIAKIIKFKSGETIVDVGTGGGFPGIPLAIMFPDTQFTLIDSIGKKIKVVNEIINTADLKNVTALQKRSNEYKEQFNFVTGRAVTAFPAFYSSVKHLVKKKNNRNGILYLKGGDFDEELKLFKKAKVYSLKKFFEKEYFETKKLIYIPK
ncbi:MAG: 16S rRNA (guanine(527)-N(7))-methyltransferase RsmG [Bacteroidales bacterium]|nr:16S rRNA (guanine(527)-N(7))-methyltransferase RsmG [Bacteroidales bacterium]